MEKMNLKKTVVITGGSSGIGKAIVKRFILEGYRVAFIGTNQRRIQQTLSEIDAEFNNPLIIGRQVDLRKPVKIKSFFNEVQSVFGEVGTLINNAGISPKEGGVKVPTHTLKRADFDDVISVNLTAPLLCVQEVLPAMMNAKFGRIIMVGSMAARCLPKFAGSAYVSSKAGLAGLGRSLASEYGSFGITTNIVSPGNVASTMTGNSNSPQNFSAVKNIPVGRIGLPGDYPGLIMYLCSDEAGFINGATIDVTGGEYVTP